MIWSALAPLNCIAKLRPTSGSSLTVSVDGTAGPFFLRYRLALGGSPSSPLFLLQINGTNTPYANYHTKNNGSTVAQNAGANAVSSAFCLGADTNANPLISGWACLDAIPDGDSFNARAINGAYSVGAGGGFQTQCTFGGLWLPGNQNAATSLVFSVSGGTPTFAAGTQIDIWQG